jgi:hypothetical protein
MRKEPMKLKTKKKNKKELSNKQEPIKVRDTLIMAILPIFFGLMGIATIDAAQPLTDILLASCIFLLILALIFPLYLNWKGIHYSSRLGDYILGFSIFYMLIHVNIPSLYLVQEHLFWFFLLIIIWLITNSTIITVYLRAKNKISQIQYDKVKKYYNHFFLWLGIISFLSFILSTLGYNRVRSYFEEDVPPAVFFLGENNGHIIIMLSFAIAMTILYGYGIFMTSERIVKRELGKY